jgi:hypothetical protein
MWGGLFIGEGGSEGEKGMSEKGVKRKVGQVSHPSAGRVGDHRV